MYKKITYILLLFLNILNASDLIGIKDAEYNDKFGEWIKEQNKVNQTIGIGYTETKLGIKYSINSSLIPLDFTNSNTYMNFEANDYRVEISVDYNLLGLTSIKSLEFKLGGGIGVDIKSSALSSFGEATLEYKLPGLFSNFTLSLTQKLFFTKSKKYKEVTETTTDANGLPISTKKLVCTNSDCTDTKNYFSLFLNYKF